MVVFVGAMARNAPEFQGTRSVSRAISLVSAIADSDNGGLLVDLADLSKLSPSTTLRLLRTLQSSEFVERGDNGKCKAGRRILQRAVRPVSKETLINQAKPHRERLAQETGESAYLGLKGPDNTVLYAASCESRAAIGHESWPGLLIPLHWTAIGSTNQGFVDGKTGVATSSMTLIDEVTAIAAPIYGGDGQIVAAISVVGPTFRILDRGIENIVRLLSEASHGLWQLNTIDSVI